MFQQSFNNRTKRV